MQEFFILFFETSPAPLFHWHSPGAGLSTLTATPSLGSSGYFEEIQQEIPGVSQVLPALRFQLSPTEMR